MASVFTATSDVDSSGTRVLGVSHADSRTGGQFGGRRLCCQLGPCSFHAFFFSPCLAALGSWVAWVAVEYEVTVRVLGARLPDVLDSYCVITLMHPCTYPLVMIRLTRCFPPWCSFGGCVSPSGCVLSWFSPAVGPDGERSETTQKSTDIARQTDAPMWHDSPDAQFIHVSELPHTALEVSLWGKKHGRDEPYGSYKIALKPAHFEESKSSVGTFVQLEGTGYNIEHPDDLANRRALEANPQDPKALKYVPVKFMPQLAIEYFCRQVPVAGQCDHCRAVMRDPLADVPIDDEEQAQAKLLELDRRRPFTLPCRHTVCGEHLFGTGVCPVCQLKVYSIENYLNYFLDKYLELRLMENSKTCAECGGPRARIYCPDCQYFFCAKCDTAIHDRNKFFRDHKRQDARKPFKVMRNHVHECYTHNLPFIKYDTTADADMEKPLCAGCIQDNEATIIRKMHADEHAIKDYAVYRKELMDKIRPTFRSHASACLPVPAPHIHHTCLIGSEFCRWRAEEHCFVRCHPCHV